MDRVGDASTEHCATKIYKQTGEGLRIGIWIINLCKFCRQFAIKIYIEVREESERKEAYSKIKSIGKKITSETS